MSFQMDNLNISAAFVLRGRRETNFIHVKKIIHLYFVFKTHLFIYQFLSQIFVEHFPLLKIKRDSVRTELTYLDMFTKSWSKHISNSFLAVC